MSRVIGLLRAVNVGGTGKLAMSDLKQFLEGQGLSGVTTLLQSGNVVFDQPQISLDELEVELERSIQAKLDLTTRFILRSGDEWRTAVAGNPFTEAAGNAPSKLMLCPLKSMPESDAVARLSGMIAGPEQIRLMGRYLYVFYPDGSGNSKLDLKKIEKAMGTTTTARNWNTVLKLLALSENEKGVA